MCHSLSNASDSSLLEFVRFINFVIIIIIISVTPHIFYFKFFVSKSFGIIDTEGLKNNNNNNNNNNGVWTVSTHNAPVHSTPRLNTLDVAERKGKERKSIYI